MIKTLVCQEVEVIAMCTYKQLAVQATVNILDWKLMIKMELSVGCLQQPTAVTLTWNIENMDKHRHTQSITVVSSVSNKPMICYNNKVKNLST